jgi:four helix bundle protein
LQEVADSFRVAELQKVMAKFGKFEEIQAWQRAYEVTLAVYKITSGGSFSKDFGLRDQIRRASVSIMANIAEGHGRRTNSEFANFLNLSRGSAAEVQSHLYIAHGLNYVSKPDFDELYQKLTEISRMTLSLAQYLRSTDK